MIRFLLLGLLRDKSRSLLPVLVVATGVLLAVLMHAYVVGVMGDTIEMNARFSIGHMKIMSQAYADNVDQVPNDLALIEVNNLLRTLENEFPQLTWSPRIRFGGLIDAPDVNGETKAQGPAMGMGMDLLTETSGEIKRLGISDALVRGALPSQPGEVLLSELFSQKLQVDPGDEVTLIGSTMYRGMAIHNFRVAGTVKFGVAALDRGTIIADIQDVRAALDMNNAAGEILGFFKTGFYNNEKANAIAEQFNSEFSHTTDEFAPIMKSLKEQENMAFFVDMSGYMTWLVTAIFMLAMSLVLWNAGLLGGLRRYGEMGVRLAIGENKRHVYFTLIGESVMIGIMGSVLGTALGLFFAWLLQTYGIDISSMMQGVSIMMPSTLKARITPADFYIGYIPGVVSTVIGTALSGIGIYKRKTARLFRELEA